MKCIITTLVIATLMLNTKAKADFPFTMKDTAKQLTATAKKLDLPIRFKNKSCSSDVKSTCQFSAGSLAGIALGDIGGRVDSITVIFAGGSDAMEGLIAWGTLIALTNPSFSPNERGAILRSMSTALQDNEELDLVKGDVRYQTIHNSTVGIWFIATSIPEQQN